ncbi:unnamed protein product [Protopolystoma xenopodis]|uniref:Uncharacterized protein n=1 Tax=Protopolystoma xenopodis TaxID=117903 RepID=A0A3S4ZQT6_9PLAT|nr:unnamed protein product [Protopolystoma xenopodis]
MLVTALSRSDDVRLLWTMASLALAFWMSAAQLEVASMTPPSLAQIGPTHQNACIELPFQLGIPFEYTLPDDLQVGLFLHIINRLYYIILYV